MALPRGDLDLEVREGQILAGKYRVERVLGVGGMGVVVAALHLQLEQRVAIKLLLPAAAKEPEIVARFAREARAAAKIQGEHVARVTDVGELENGAPYMVMEYLVGKDLAATLEERGQLPISEAVDYVLQAAEAIAEAHAAGIVHRDLKPANLFLTRRPDGNSIIKVLDFGISKAAISGQSEAEMSLTKTASVMGSPFYMSPEQMRSTRSVDARADIWALGVVLYELLAGRVPFEATSMPELCALILTEAPKPVSVWRADCPRALEMAISRCLEKEPANRFASVVELANAIVPFASSVGQMCAPRISRILGAQEVPPPPTSAERGTRGEGSLHSTEGTWAETGPRTRTGRSTTWISVGAAVSVAGAALLVWFLWRSPGVASSSDASVKAPGVLVGAATASPTAPTVSPPSVPLGSNKVSEASAPLVTPVEEVIPPQKVEPSAPPAATKNVRLPARSRIVPKAAHEPSPLPSTAPPPVQSPPPPPPTKKNPLNIDLK